VAHYFIGAAGAPIDPEPLTEDEYYEYVRRVNCGRCWARPGDLCLQMTEEGNIIIPIRHLTDNTTPPFHPEREIRSWAKLGVPPRAET
jgi:hypothetical protein